MPGTLAPPGRKGSARPGPTLQPKLAAWTGLNPMPPLQAKLEVGPAHDRFEAEADRVASAVTGTQGPAALPPSISPLDTSPTAARKPIQREEQRPIEQREQKPQQATDQDLAPLLQRKADPKPLRKGEHVQKKAATSLQRKPDSKPSKKPEEKVQRKADPKPAKKEEEVVQAQPLAGRLQRDSVEEDTVLETTIQMKRQSASLQREVVAAESRVAQTDVEREKAEPVQRDAIGGGAFAAPAGVESGIAAMRGHGDPLGSDVRADMEPRFGRDLSDVRIHSGARAGELSNAVHARAFTFGQDVFFGAGQYQPSSSSGRALLAHELTHTIQQRGGSSRAQPSRIQRVPAPGAAAAASTTAPAADGATAPTAEVSPVFTHAMGTLTVADTGNIIDMTALPIPTVGENKGWKGSGPGAKAASGKPAIPATVGTPWQYKGKSPRGGVTARQQWLTEMRADPKGVAEKIGALPNVKASKIERGGQKIAYLKSANSSGQGLNFLLIGTPKELAVTDEVLLPIWNAEGNGALFDVDHIQELQLGGLDGFPNFWLLDQGTNRSSGSNIASEMKADFNTLVSAADTAGYFIAGRPKPIWDQLRQPTGDSAPPWQIQYRAFREISTSGSGAHWTKGDIAAGKHIGQLSALSETEIMARGLIYAVNPERVEASIFALRTGRGGFFRTVNYKNPANVVTTDSLGGGSVGTGKGVAGNQFYKGLAVAESGFQMTMAPSGGEGSGPAKAILGSQELKGGETIATIHGQPFPASGKITAPAVDIPIKWAPEFGFGGYADTSWINEKLARISIAGASPVEIYESGLTPQGELFATGEILATKALFPNLRIPIKLRGNEIYVSFPIPTDRLSFGPVKVTDASIDIGYGANGLFLGGEAGVKVDSVGSGRVTARATAEDTVIAGKFDFNLSFLDKASADISYSMARDELKLTLNAGVKEGVLPGVTSGTVTGQFSREAIDITGTLNLAPPLNGSTITLGYTEREGLTIAANNIPLPVSNIPGIDNAVLSARANYNPDDGQWKLSGEGHAHFNVPPATGDLTVALDGSAIMIKGDAAFQQGIASGSLSITATNAVLDEQGQPVPGQSAPRFTVTGKGSAALKFGILTGTAGIEMTQDERIIIAGAISLPPSHQLFDKRSYQKELLHVEPPEFPIWGVSVAGVGLGIFAFVDARLSFDAFVGPGTLENTTVSVTFDLDKPQEAVVDGTAAFVVPAGAGFTLDIGGGLRARAAVAYVQGRVGLDARLGLLALARADVNLHWTQNEGLSLAASAHAEARPQFEVGANASVTAGVDLGITEIDKTWGPWRKQLGSFGPEMAVGVTVPIAWSEQAGLDFNTDKIEITRPDIDFGALMTDGFLQLV